MKKNNIRMIVQGGGECAEDFAERLERNCNQLSKKYASKIKSVPTVVMTSASDGRQTATIQFITKSKSKSKSK
mgnify:FL=1